MNETSLKVYAVKHKDFDTRINSMSGGIFTALSDLILRENGVVYGCVLTQSFEVLHIRAENIEDRNKMRGSKYVQSDMKDCFKSVLCDLNSNKKVLFSGTSCQVAGLKAFLKVPYDNLLCVDVLCYGVPSPKIFKSYLAWQEQKNKGKCIYFEFRNKKDFGWDLHFETLMIKKKNNKKIKINSRIFRTFFFSHNIIRPACHKCPYKDILHPSDITIADYWGIDKAIPNFNDNKGVSLVLINNKKGQEVFENVKNDIVYKESKIEDCMQQTLIRPSDISGNRTEFWEDYKNINFNKMTKKYGGNNFKNYALNKYIEFKKI